jgi:hypothetical protein
MHEFTWRCGILTSEELFTNRFTNSCNKFYEQAPKARRKTVATLDKLDICHRQKSHTTLFNKRVDTAPVGRGGTDPQASHSAQHQTVAPLA